MVSGRRSEYDLRHLGLHCEALHLELPDGETLDVRCPVRPDLLAVWRQLPWWEQACEALPALVEDAKQAQVSPPEEQDGARSTVLHSGSD